MLLALIRLAASYGYEIHGAHLDDGVLGYTSPKEGRIYYDLSLTPDEMCTTIAHEIGHVHNGHTCDGPREEYQADLFAARLLVDPEIYAQHERFNPDPHYIAEEMGVTVELIQFFEQHCLTQLRGVTYAHARHGKAQASFRGFFSTLGVAHG